MTARGSTSSRSRPRSRIPRLAKARNTPPDKSRAWELEHDPEKWEPVFRKDHAQKVELDRHDDIAEYFAVFHGFVSRNNVRERVGRRDIVDQRAGFEPARNRTERRRALGGSKLIDIDELQRDGAAEEEK